MYFDDIYSLYLPYYSVWIPINLFSSQLHVLPPSTFRVARKDMINNNPFEQGNLSVSTCLRQIDSSSPSSQQLSISSQLGMIRLSHPCYNF